MGMFDYVRFGDGVFEENTLEFNGKKIDLLTGFLEGSPDSYEKTNWQTKIRDFGSNLDLLEIKKDEECYLRVYTYEWDRPWGRPFNPNLESITESGQIYLFDDFLGQSRIFINICILDNYIFFIEGNIHLAKEKNDELEYEYIPIKFKELKTEKLDDKLKEWLKKI